MKWTPLLMVAYSAGFVGQFLCYNLQRLGREIDPNLPGDDRPDLIAVLYAEPQDWLMKKP